MEFGFIKQMVGVMGRRQRKVGIGVQQKRGTR